MDIFLILSVLFIIWILYEIITYKKSAIFIDNRLYVDNSTLNNSGYGIFTRGYIPKDTIIEISHCIPLLINERDNLSTIIHYDFTCPSYNHTLIAMGFGGIYNHHKNNNVNWIPTDKTIKYITNKNIYPGEELFINYGHNYFKLHGLEESF